MMDIYAENVEGVWFGVAYLDKEVFATYFGSDEENVVQGLIRSLPSDVTFRKLERSSPFAKHVITVLKDVYDGKGFSSSLPLALQHLSEYSQKVLRATSLIPLGYVASYGSIARVAGGSPRGVGRVMASNPFAPIIPCHRVVGSDFGLVGYGGGLQLKLDFLRRERKGYSNEREISVGKGRLKVFPVEFALKKARKH